MKIEILSWDAALRTEREAWCELLQRRNFNPSLHPDWLDISLKSWSLADAVGVAVAREGASTRAVIPFIVRRRTLMGLPCRTLELASNVFSYHAEIVSDSIDECLLAMLRERGLPAWDAFRAVNIVADGPSGKALRSVAIEAGYPMASYTGERSPFLAIQQGWEEFLRTRPKKLRANVSRSERLMKDAGESGMSWYETGADVQRLLDEILEVESRSWKAGAGAAIEPGTPQHSYYQRLLPWLATHGLMANVLHVRGRPVAYTLCACWNGWIGQLKTSYVAELRDAGSRVIHSSLQRGFEAGYMEYDFLGDSAPHKTRWADQIREHRDYWLFGKHLRGRALSSIQRFSDSVRRRKNPSESQATEHSRSEVEEA